MSLTDWWWYSGEAGPPPGPVTGEIMLAPLPLTMSFAEPDVRLSSEDRPTGLTTKVYRGTDYRHPVAVLSKETLRSGRIALTDAGTGSMTIPNRQPDRNLVQPRDLIRVELDGEAIHQWSVRRDMSKTYRDTQGKRVTTFSGPGTLGLLAGMPVLPSLGEKRLPIERDRIWGWMSPSPIFDDSGWGFAQSTASAATDYWGDVDNWPSGLGEWIGAPGDSTTLAPEGYRYFRKTWTSTGGRRRFYVRGDDTAHVYVDGMLYGKKDAWTNSGSDLITFEIDVSPGTHTIAILNLNGDALPGEPGVGPAAIRAGALPVDSQGVVSPFAEIATDATWRCLAYPLVPPGMTIGEVLHGLFAEWQALGLATGWELAFTELADSNGTPFDYGEFGTKVGTDGRTFILDELGSTYIDVKASNGGLVLYVYRLDTAGVARTLDLHAATDRGDRSSGTLLALDHDREAPRATGMLVLTQNGWLFEDDTADGELAEWVLLGLGAQPSENAARVVARGEIARFRRTREAITAEVTRGADIRDADVGDSITTEDRDEEPVVERVMAWTYDEDQHGTVKWIPEMKDPCLTAEERRENALKKMADGTVRGASKVATPTSQIDTPSGCCAPQPTPPCD